MLPNLATGGSLPPGIHTGTWAEVEMLFAQTEHRAALLAGCRAGAQSLRGAGCARLWLDGSFVTDKPIPGDFDAVWDPAGVDLLALDPVLLDFAAGRASQKAKYGGEFFPNRVEAGSGQPFLDFFQNDLRNGGRKGIVQLDL